MKKLKVSLLLLTFICVLVTAGSAYSTIGINTAIIPPESTGSVMVYISGVENAEGLSFNLTFDQSIIQIAGVVNTSAVPGSTIQYNADNVNGKLAVSLTNPEGINVSTQANIAEILITPVGTGGESVLTFSGSSHYSKGFEPVAFDSSYNGFVVVRDKRTIISPSGDITGQGSWLPVKVANISGAKYVSVELMYDGSYASIEDIAPSASGIIITYGYATNGVSETPYSLVAGESDLSEIPEDLIARAESHGHNWAWISAIIPSGLSGDEQSVVDIYFTPTENSGTANTSAYGNYRDTVEYSAYSADEQFYFDQYVPGQVTSPGGGVTPGGDAKIPSGDLTIGATGVFPVQIKGYTGSDGCAFSVYWNSSALSSVLVGLNQSAVAAGVTIDSLSNYSGSCYADLGNLSGFNSDSWASLFDFRFTPVGTESGLTWINFSYLEGSVDVRDNVTIWNPAKTLENGVITVKKSQKPDLVGHLIDPPKYIKKFKNGSVRVVQTMVIDNIGNSPVTTDFKINATLDDSSEELDITMDIDPGKNVTLYIDANTDPNYLGKTEAQKKVGASEIWLTILSNASLSLTDYEIGLGIDINNDIDEVNEDNNFNKTTAQITYPDLVPVVNLEFVDGIKDSNTTIVDSVTVVPGKYKLTYGVNNTGNVYAIPTKLNLTRNGASSTVDIPQLNPGENWTSSTEIDVGRAFTDYRIEVNSDRSEAETNYTNNVYEESLGSFSPVTVVLPHITDGETGKDSDVEIRLTNITAPVTSFQVTMTYDPTVCINTSPVVLPVPGITVASSYGRFVISGSGISITEDSLVASVKMRARSDAGRKSDLASVTSSFVKTTGDNFIELEIHEGVFEQVNKTDASVSLFSTPRGSVDQNQSVSVTITNQRSNPVTLDANLTADSNKIWEMSGISLGSHASRTYQIKTWKPAVGKTYTLNATISGDDEKKGNEASRDIVIDDYSLEITTQNKNYWDRYYKYNKSTLINEYFSVGTYYTANQAAKVNATLSIFYANGTPVDLSDDSVFDLYYYYPAERQVYGSTNSWNSVVWYYITPKELGMFNYSIFLEARGKESFVNGSIEVREPNVDIKVLNTTILTDNGVTEILAFDLFKRDSSENEKFNVYLSAGAEGRTLQGLESIIGYPHGCPEQTMSPALVALRVKQYYESKGALTDDINATILTTMQKALDRMNPPNGYNAQQIPGIGDSSGGWAWGHSSYSRPSMFYTLYPNYVITEMLDDNDPAFWDVKDNMSQIDLNMSADWLIKRQKNDGYWLDYGYISDKLEWTGYISEKLTNEYKYLNDSMKVKVNSSLDLAQRWMLNYTYTASEDTQPLSYVIFGLTSIRDFGIGNSTDINSTVSEIKDIIKGQKVSSGGDFYWGSSWNKYEPTADAALALLRAGEDVNSAEISGGVRYLIGNRAGRTYSGGWGSTRTSAAVVNTLTQVVPDSEIDFTVNVELKNPDGTSVWKQDGLKFDKSQYSLTHKLSSSELSTLYGFAGTDVNGTGKLVISNKVDTDPLNKAKLSVSVDSFEEVPESVAYASIAEEFIDPIATDFNLSVNVQNDAYDLKEGDTRDVEFTIENNRLNPVNQTTMIIEVSINNDVNFTGSEMGQDKSYYLKDGNPVFITHMYNKTSKKLYVYPGSDDEAVPSVLAGQSKAFYVPLKFENSGNTSVESRVYPMYNDTWMALGTGNTYVKGYGNITLAAVDENNNPAPATYYIDGVANGTATSIDKELLEGRYSVGINNGSLWVNTTLNVEPSESVTYTAHFASDTTVPFIAQAEGAVDEMQMMPPEIEDTTSNSSVDHWNAAMAAMKSFNSTISSSGGTATISVDMPTLTRSIGTINLNDSVSVMVYNGTDWNGPYSGNESGGTYSLQNVDTSVVEQIMFNFDGRRLGDADKDSRISLNDAVTIAQYRAQVISLTGNDQFYGDVDGDGRLSLNDAVTIAQYRAQLLDNNYQSK